MMRLEYSLLIRDITQHDGLHGEAHVPCDSSIIDYMILSEFVVELPNECMDYRYGISRSPVEDKCLESDYFSFYMAKQIDQCRFQHKDLGKLIMVRNAGTPKKGTDIWT